MKIFGRKILDHRFDWDNVDIENLDSKKLLEMVLLERVYRDTVDRTISKKHPNNTTRSKHNENKNLPIKI